MSLSPTPNPLVQIDGNRIRRNEECTMKDRLLTLKEVAALLGVPVATLRWWRHKGVGPASFKIGRLVKYQSSDVDRWIQAQRRSGGTTTA
jgi:excisionase family DNA binding protein